MVKPKTELTLKVRAMRYLARREHSRAELRAKLLPHAGENEDVERLLDDFTSRGWLSDQRAAEQLLIQRRNRFGAQRIAHELRQKGISENLIDAAMPELKATELETAREVWRRKFGEQPRDQKEKARQVRFLQSRGFSSEVVFKLLRACGEEEISWPESGP